MYMILSDWFKYILYEITDYLEGKKKRTIIIDLRTEKGMQLYKKIFGREPWQPKKRKRKRNWISSFQTKLTDFLDKVISLIAKWRSLKLPYKLKLYNSKCKAIDVKEDIAEDQLIAYENYPSFRGYLSHMFSLNSIDEFFLSLQYNLGYEPQSSILSLNNIIKLEIARCKLGYNWYGSFLSAINSNSAIRRELGIADLSSVSERSYLRNLRVIGAWNINRYAEFLREECRKLNLIGDKIWIWDRRFFQCNCNGKKNELGELSDLEAGHYVKKSGSHKVLSGTGYTDSGFVDSWYGLPIYFDAVGAHHNDNPIFQNSFREAIKSINANQKPRFVIADGGADSARSNELIVEEDIVPIISARKNSIGNIIKTEKGNYFRGDYIPREYHYLSQRLYDLRTVIERRNSNEVVSYNRQFMPQRGIEWARIFIAISNLTSLLTALTACKIGRFDLIRAPSAFRKITPNI